MPQDLCSRKHPTDTRCIAWESSSETSEQQRCWRPDSFLASHCDDPRCSRSWASDVDAGELERCNAECVSEIITAAQWQPGPETVAATNASLSNDTRPRQACGLDIPPAVVQAMLAADDGDKDDLAASGAISATIVAAKEFVLIAALVLLFASSASCCNCKRLTLCAYWPTHFASTAVCPPVDDVLHTV